MAKRPSSTLINSAPKKIAHWSQGLLSSMNDPEMKVQEFDDMVIIKDKYPKARFHFLVMPLKSIASLKHLTKTDIPLLELMQERGKAVMEGKTEDFRCGYHAVPSMSHLHLHVISQDFDSPCFKTKKHWNSFTTSYFVDSEEVIQRLREKGSVEFDRSKFEQLLKGPLKCHKCQHVAKTIPSLKEHLRKH